MIRNVRFLSGILFALVLLTGVTYADTLLFADDFNRSDSATVGNGWINDTSLNGVFSIKNQQMINMTGGDAAVHRHISYTGAVTISADFSEHNGYGGLPRRYGNWFLIKSDGANNGYGVGIGRADINYPSRVELIEDGQILTELDAPFQYGPQLHASITFNPDGSISATVSQPGDSFTFSFPPRTVISTGNDLTVYVSPPDTVTTNTPLYPWIDNIQVTGTSPNPADQVQDLINSISSSKLSKSVQNSYLANLKKVPQFIQDGKKGPAINELNAFIRKVNQDFSHSVISLSQKNDLLAAANTLVTELQ